MLREIPALLEDLCMCLSLSVLLKHKKDFYSPSLFVDDQDHWVSLRGLRWEAVAVKNRADAVSAATLHMQHWKAKKLFSSVAASVCILDLSSDRWLCALCSVFCLQSLFSCASIQISVIDSYRAAVLSVSNHCRTLIPSWCSPQCIIEVPVAS